MIRVTRASRKSTIAFSIKEWHKLDVPHYGRRIEFNEQTFRFKATENGNVVGLISGKHVSGVVYIDQIITAEKARRRGIGTVLIRRVEEFGRKVGAHKLWLMTGKDWSENAFYKKLGFRIEATLSDHHFQRDFFVYSRAIKVT